MLQGRCTERGFSLIEALVTVLIVAVSLLGHLTLQQRTIVNQQAAQAQGHATGLVLDLAERIVANPSAITSYDSDGSSFVTAVPAAATNCAAAASCSPEQLAGFDLDRWFTRARAELPNAMFRISDPQSLGTRSNQFQITVGWNEQRNGVIPTNCDSPNAKCITIIRVL